MKGKRFTDEQIIGILQEAEAGLSVAGVCRKHNCSEHWFYRWKTKFGDMQVSESRKRSGSESMRTQSSRRLCRTRHWTFGC